MSKKWYKLIFKQMEPIHIGTGNYGVLSETRIFIPGWTMWGALTKRYGRYLGGTEEDFNVSKELFKTISCFFPSFKENENPLFPTYVDGLSYLGSMSEKDFRAEFTDTYISTAISPVMQAAKDELLHEIEVILPMAKTGMKESNNSLYWSGLFSISDDESVADSVLHLLKEGLELKLGGESRYGFGRIKLIRKCEITKEELEFWGLDEEGKSIANTYLKNYSEYCNGIFEIGKIEHIIVEADFSIATPKIKESKICLVPGSKANASGVLERGIYIQT